MNMTSKTFSRFLLLVFLLAEALVTSAQAANLYVGSNSSSQSTNFTSGTNSYSNTYVGYVTTGSNSLGNSNTLTVTGTGTILTNSANVYVGYANNSIGGNSNSLSISGGANVSESSLSIGYEVYGGNFASGSGNGNSLTVSGGGILTNSGNFTVGNEEYGNGGNGNTATISNSTMFNSGSVTVGQSIDDGLYTYKNPGGDSNTLTLNASSFTAGGIYIGYGDYNTNGISGGDNNHVTINASSVTNTGDLVIGFADYGLGGNYNSLTLTNGASMTNSGNLAVGTNNDPADYSGGNGNTLTIAGGSTLSLASNTYIGIGASSNTITVTSSNSLLSNSGNLYVGYGNGSNAPSIGNSLIVSNGASLGVGNSMNDTGDLQIGAIRGDVSNSVFVYSNSSISVYNNINIGCGDASSNSLVVTGPNASVSNYSGNGLYLGVGSTYGSIGNSLVISNGGSVIVGDGGIQIGGIHQDVSNTITVYANSSLSDFYFLTIGNGDASFNAVTVTGSNAIIDLNGNSLSVGLGTNYGSIGNSLVISNGGTVNAGGLVVGNMVQDVSNTVTVYGNSTLTVSGNSDIGNQDAGSNTVTVTGSNAVMNNTGYLHLGNGASTGGNGNSLVISNGGAMTIGGGLAVGYYYYSAQNSVIVTGVGSTLDVTGLTVGANSGYEGASNSLVISNGGVVTAGDMYVGNWQSTCDTVIVTGLGSALNLSGAITLGQYGSIGNVLSLDNGASIIAPGGISISTGSTLTGNGTITASAGTVISGTFAPTGTNALTVNGDLTFTGGTYLWNLYNNSTSAAGGTNFTVPVVLNGALSVDTNSVFDLNFSGAVNGSSSFWTNSQHWLVTAGTNPLSAGTNFGLAWANPAASAGFNLADFSLSASGTNFYLNYNAPLITNPTIAADTNTALPSYNQGSNTVLVITAPTNGTAVLSGTNPALTGIFVNSGTLASTNQSSIPTNANVTVYGGTMGFTGPGTNIIGSLFVSGGSVAASNTIVNVQSFVQTGGTLSGGTNATYWAANYYFAATNPATVAAALANLGTVSGYQSTAVVTTNSSGAPVAPVVFANSMQYSGGTVISGGILQLGSSDSTGAVTVQGNITNNGFLNFGFNGNSTTPTNVVIGSGVIGQIGTGTLTIGTNGIDNSFTGSFGVANGTLAITTNSALGGSTNFYLASGGTLQATTGVTNITNVNVTNGTGIIDNASGGTLALNGTLTKSGTVLVLAGGNFDVNGQVTGGGASGSFNSDLVVSNATATLNSGNNNYTGPTYVEAGSSLSNGIVNALPVNTVLNMGATTDGSVTNRYDMAGYNQTLAGLASAGTAANFVTNTGAATSLTINGSTNTTYAGVIGGNIALTRAGTGAITLTTNNTYTGGTTISSGKIVTLANSSLGSGTVGLSGGSLEIHSLLTIGAFTWSGGQVAIPTLTSTNGVYLASTNGLTISGGSHIFNLTGASVTIGTPTKLLGATNMTSNNFTTSEFAVTGVGNYSLLISNDILWIDLLNNPAPAATAPVYPNFVGYAVNRNQTNVALALNSFTNNPNADQTAVLTSLTALTNSPGSMQQAFNAIMPNFYQQMATIAFNSANAQNMELSQRLWGMRVAEGGGFSMNGFGDNTPMIQEGQGDGDGKGVLDAKKDILRPGLDNRWGMFLDANGIFAQANSGNMLPGYQSESGGVTTGLTYKWNKNVSSGIYAGYQGTYDKLGAAGSGLGVGSTLIDNAVRFGFFGTYGQVNSKGEPLGFYANALAGGAYNNYQASRIIQYPGINRTATSQPGAGELDSMIAGGYDLKAGNFTYGPSASLQYTYLGANGVNETGAQSLDYNSSGWNSSSMLSSVGAHGAYTWMVNKLEGHEVAVVPQISLNWQHEFMQNPYAINGNLGGTTPNFSNWSATPIRDFLYTGVGVTVEFAKRWNTSFFYNAAAGNKDLVSQNIFLSAGLKF